MHVQQIHNRFTHFSKLEVSPKALFLGPRQQATVDQVMFGAKANKLEAEIPFLLGNCSYAAISPWANKLELWELHRTINKRKQFSRDFKVNEQALLISAVYLVLEHLPPASNQLEAYAQLMTVIVAVENDYRGSYVVIDPEKIYSAGPRTLFATAPIKEANPFNHPENVYSQDYFIACRSPFNITFIGQNGDFIDMRRDAQGNIPDNSDNLSFRLNGHIFHKKGVNTKPEDWFDVMQSFLIKGLQVDIPIRKYTDDSTSDFHSKLRHFLSGEGLEPINGLSVPERLVTDTSSWHVRWRDSNLDDVVELFEKAPIASNPLEAFSVIYEVLYQYGSVEFGETFLLNAKDYLLHSYLYPVDKEKLPDNSAFKGGDYLIYNPAIPFTFLLKDDGSFICWQSNKFPNDLAGLKNTDTFLPKTLWLRDYTHRLDKTGAGLNQPKLSASESIKTVPDYFQNAFLIEHKSLWQSG